MGLVAAILIAFALQAGPLESVVVIANKGIPETHLTPEALKDIYTGKTMYWDDGQRVVIVTLADKTCETALSEISGMDPTQFRTFWQRMVFSGRGQQPKKAGSPADLAALVAATKGAIALAPATADLKDVTIIQVK